MPTKNNKPAKTKRARTVWEVSAKKPARHRSLWAAVILFTLGINLCAAAFWYCAYQKTVLSFQTTPMVTAPLALRGSVPVAIKIDNVSIDLPLLPAQIDNGIWQTSSAAPTYLVSSARPAEGGNVVIYGHNFARIFGNLKNVKVGDTITLHTEDGKTFSYKVKETEVINPEDVSAVLPTNHEVLTVYTCTGLLDSQRLVVKAYPTSDTATTLSAVTK